MSTILALVKKKCQHSTEVKQFRCVMFNETFGEIFSVLHCGTESATNSADPSDHDVHISCSDKTDVGEGMFDVDKSMTVGSVADKFNIKTVLFRCVSASQVQQITKSPPRKENAFDLLGQSKKRGYPPEKAASAGMKTGLNRKDELYNEVIKMMHEDSVDLPVTEIGTEGAYIAQVLTNALWYVTNQQEAFHDASLHHKSVKPIPEKFNAFTGFNELKRKKLKAQPMNSNELHSHGQALYSICLRPIMNTNRSWVGFHENVKTLADCLLGFIEHLKDQSQASAVNRNRDAPARSLATNLTVEPRRATFAVKDRYKILNRILSTRALEDPLFFDEDEHIETPFQTNTQRFRFFADLQLTVPIDLDRYAPGGTIVSSTCIVRVDAIRTDDDKLTQPLKLLPEIQKRFPVFHTRAQRNHFKTNLGNVAKISPSTADMIYKELAIDATTASHPHTQQRLRAIFMGEEGLLADLRELNAGRPTGKYDVFFAELRKIVENVTAADERRHKQAHLSEWISLPDLIQQANDRFPPGTPIPSKTLVRLQFAPTNPYTRSALRFTSKIDVQYKIQRRQLRASPPDEHYCSAQFKYMKSMAIDLGEKCATYSVDDKAKIPIGSPDVVVSTGVRGKKTLAPTGTTIVACDHDMTNCSLTPSVYLRIKVPKHLEDSFVRGQVTTLINDAVFQQSNPFRHACTLSRLHTKDGPKILLKFTDGGTDQRNNLETVKCATICLFLDLNLDMLVLARCSPGHSWTNPVERVMSVLNLGLQNCALSRNASDDQVLEKVLKSCSSMADIRASVEKHANLREEWPKLVTPVKEIVQSRFTRLRLKDDPIVTTEPINDADIDQMKDLLTSQFPNLDPNHLTKALNDKDHTYRDWVQRHCRERKYSFQVRKCDNTECCSSPVNKFEDLTWLPDPVLDDTELHFKSYSELKGVATTEKDCPSQLKKAKQSEKPTKAKQSEKQTKVRKSAHEATTSSVPDNLNVYEEEEEATPCTTTVQTARSTVTCVECRKPRVIFSQLGLTERQKILMACLISEFDYTCGAHICPPEHSLKKKIFVKLKLSCESPIELAYYGAKLGRVDLCSFCASVDAKILPEKSAKFKTVLPICDQCVEQGMSPICQRPYKH